MSEKNQDQAPDVGPDGEISNAPTEQSGYTTDFAHEGVDDYDPIAERRRIRREQAAILFKSPAFVVGSVIVVFWVLCAIWPSLFTSLRPNDANPLGDRLAPQSGAWFGTYRTTSNDVYTRVIYGARPVMIVAPIAAFLSAIFGTVLGLAMGYLRGWVDEILSRIVEAILSLPVILLALLVVTMFGTATWVVTLTIAALFTPVVARTVRSAVLAEAQLDYVTSAQLRGESSFFIMSREILPNVAPVAVVEFTVRVGYAVFTVATLAFLGLGSDDDTIADWGRDVSDQADNLRNGYWWGAIFPALAIASLVIAINLVADSLDRVSKS